MHQDLLRRALRTETVLRVRKTRASPSVKACFDARDQARGLAMTYGPKYLRFFQARFEPL
jgi:tyrosine phenol-lyase